MIVSIHARAVRRLPRSSHDGCWGVGWRCRICLDLPVSRQPTSDESTCPRGACSGRAICGSTTTARPRGPLSGARAVACRLRHLALLWYQRSGISTAIEAGLPEAILWMQSGHAHDVAAPQYMSPVQDVGGRPSASEDPPAPPEPHGALLLFCTSSAAVGGCSCLARSESRDRIRSRDRPSSTAGSGPPLTGDVTQPGVLSGDGAWAGSGFYHSVFTL